MSKQKTMKRNVPSEAKIPCNYCERRMKFRELRKHMSTTHEVDRLTILCTQDFSCKTNWSCSYSFDCFLEHAKKDHNEFFNGSETDFKPENGFRLCEFEVLYEKRSEICEKIFF